MLMHGEAVHMHIYINMTRLGDTDATCVQSNVPHAHIR